MVQEARRTEIEFAQNLFTKVCEARMFALGGLGIRGNDLSRSHLLCLIVLTLDLPKICSNGEHGANTS